MSARNEVGDWILDKRAEYKLSHNDLAKELGVGQGRISDWERGRCYPPRSIMRKMFRFFGETHLGFIEKCTKEECGKPRGGSRGADRERRSAPLLVVSNGEVLVDNR